MKKDKKESISTASTFTIRFTIAITIININMMHAYAYFVRWVQVFSMLSMLCPFFEMVLGPWFHSEV